MTLYVLLNDMNNQLEYGGLIGYTKVQTKTLTTLPTKSLTRQCVAYYKISKIETSITCWWSSSTTPNNPIPQHSQLVKLLLCSIIYMIEVHYAHTTHDHNHHHVFLSVQCFKQHFPKEFQLVTNPVVARACWLPRIRSHNEQLSSCLRIITWSSLATQLCGLPKIGPYKVAQTYAGSF